MHYVIRDFFTVIKQFLYLLYILYNIKMWQMYTAVMTVFFFTNKDKIISFKIKKKYITIITSFH